MQSYYASANLCLYILRFPHTVEQSRIPRVNIIAPSTVRNPDIVKVLKKYPNRRIYDTESSQFVTLSDVRQMILDQVRLQVVDSRTGKDLTRSVLLQIISDLESEGHQSVLTDRALEAMICFYGHLMAQVAGPIIEQQILYFLQEQDRLREEYAKAWSIPPNSAEDFMRRMATRSSAESE